MKIAKSYNNIMQTGIDAIEGITEAFQNAVDSGFIPPVEESTNMTWDGLECITQ